MWQNIFGEACATDGCSYRATSRLIVGGVGSDYCSDCRTKIEAVLAMKEAIEIKGDVYGLHPITEKKMIEAMNALEKHTGEMKPKMQPIEIPKATPEQVAYLESLVYCPGVWRCVKCDFRLIQSNLNANTGTVTARNEPGDKCPNCNSPLWRVSERQERVEAMDMAEQQFMRADAAEKALAEIHEILDREIAGATKTLEMDLHEGSRRSAQGWLSAARGIQIAVTKVWPRNVPATETST